MQGSPYWNDIAHEQQKLQATLTRDPGLHPFKDGACYLVSKRSRVHLTEAGKISLVPLKLAAQRIVDDSHELANDDQIREYLAEQQKKREVMKAAEQQSKNPMLTFAPVSAKGPSNG